MKWIVEYRALMSDGSIEELELEIMANTAREVRHKAGLAVLDAARNNPQIKRARMQRIRAK